MLKKLPISLFIACLGCYFPSSWATTLNQSAKSHLAQNPISSSSTQVETMNIKNTPIVEDKWSEWGLTKEDWKKYQTLKNGSRGIWTPNLDPLTTLGVEASTEQERKHYAELLARKEFERVEKEFAFQIAYSEAFSRLYPNLLPFRNTTSSPEKKSILETALANKNARILYFTQIDCLACQQDLTRLLQHSGETPIDIYFVDSQNNNERILNWAIQNRIDTNKVKQRKITLNHDKGYWQQYADGKIPVAFKVDQHGQWLDLVY